MASGVSQVFVALVRQNVYANGVLFQEAEKIGQEQLETTVSPSRDSAYRLLLHLLAVEDYFLAQLRGVNHAVRKDTATNLASIRALAEEHDRTFTEYVAMLSDDDLASEAAFAFSEGPQLRLPVWQILTQVLLHSAQHRGELSILLSGLGHPLPVDDIIVRLVEESGQPWPFKGK